MPTQTFLKLSLIKREKFIQAALIEFSQNNYETASINVIIKNLGIARGSVYQYFKDKLDLWLFLKSYAEEQKLKYIQSVKREDYSDFWEYYTQIYINGINFDLEQPLCSQLLYRIGFKESSQELLPYMNDWKIKSRQFLTQWVKAEQKSGSINKEIPLDVAVHFLISMSLSIADLLQTKYAVNFDKNLKEGKSLFATNIKVYKKAVNDLVLLLKKALN